MKSAIVFGLIAFGFMLLIASSMWTTLFPATSTWTEEKAQRSSDVKARLTDLGPLVNSPKKRMHSGDDLGKLAAEFAELRKENDVLNAEYESAAVRPHTTARILKWTGILLAVVGIVGWYAVKNMDS